MYGENGCLHVIGFKSTAVLTYILTNYVADSKHMSLRNGMPLVALHKQLESDAMFNFLREIRPSAFNMKLFSCCRTFQPELEKCLEEPDRLGATFVRYVSLLLLLFLQFVLLTPDSMLISICVIDCKF